MSRRHAARRRTNPSLSTHQGGMSVSVYPSLIRPDGVEEPVYFDVDTFVNMANMNAARVFDLLAIEHTAEGLVGSMDAADFLGRVLLARGLTPADAGTPSVQEGNVILCGRPEGYLQDRLDELETLARGAVARGERVAWS